MEIRSTLPVTAALPAIEGNPPASPPKIEEVAAWRIKLFAAIEWVKKNLSDTADVGHSTVPPKPFG